MESRIERLCIERGLKMTGQRRVIARVLSDAEDHPDVEELYRRASALDGHISIATVYRTVRLLEEKGILERRDFGGGRARYEPTEHGIHYHLIDVESGKVIEFQDAEHERLIREIAGRLGFEMVSLRLEVFGRRLNEPATTSPPGPSASKARRRRPSRDRHGTRGRREQRARRTVVMAATPPDLSSRSTASVPEGGPFQELRAGHLGVRIASSDAEIDAVQALRFRVFYDEMGATPDAASAEDGRDRDLFDRVADHLLVVDHTLGSGPESVVGTYRLIRQAAADRIGHFYSSGEYDIAPLVAFPGRILELGRSCVAGPYRNRAVMQLLWRGIAAYVFKYRIGLMFGCASLSGTDPDAIGEQLTYLYTNHLAPPDLRVRALPDRYVDMRRVAPEAIDRRRTLAQLPPLIKGYLRLGGFVGDGAVIDRQFNTTDVAVVVQTDLVTDKYYRHYEREALSPGNASTAHDAVRVDT